MGTLIYPCTHCGACCIGIGSCSKGKEDEYGACIYVHIHSNDTVTCSLLEKGLVKPEDIGIRGNGCAMKENQNAYQYCLNKTKELIPYIKKQIELK